MQQLWVAGFNAFEQLHTIPQTEPDDVFSFRQVVQGESIQVIQSESCNTFINVDGTLQVLGLSILTPPEHEVSLMFNKLLAVSAAGYTLLADQADQDVSDPRLHHKCTLKLYLNTQDCRDGNPHRTSHLDLFVKQTAAWDTGFIILLEDGTVRTMGDARYGMCLGRAAPDAGESWEPGELPDLEGLGEKFVQIAAGGYTVAALTQSGSVYVWGMQTEGAYRRSQPFTTMDATPNYVEVDGGKDVARTAVGANHAICLTTEGTVYVIGGNENGQLGIGRSPKGRAYEWVKVTNGDLLDGQKVVDIYAGPRASFIITVEHSEAATDAA